MLKMLPHCVSLRDHDVIVLYTIIAHKQLYPLTWIMYKYNMSQDTSLSHYPLQFDWSYFTPEIQQECLLNQTILFFDLALTLLLLSI